MAANLALKTSTQPSYFYLFKSPTIIMPPVGIMRRLVYSPSSRLFYKQVFEKNFTREKFFNGAIMVCFLFFFGDGLVYSFLFFPSIWK
ncbi:unnamed protein product [Meloidogyne enterolobii]|uniref:Uncharacterized protein n=1 Tax=Meloidogyne enterolobii TaxID=390850 RepID=A0ACB1A2X4_MELEN